MPRRAAGSAAAYADRPGREQPVQQAAPILYANNTNNANSIAGVFDYLGRYYWARVTVSF
jgi:hypothetical protein